MVAQNILPFYVRLQRKLKHRTRNVGCGGGLRRKVWIYCNWWLCWLVWCLVSERQQIHGYWERKIFRKVLFSTIHHSLRWNWLLMVWSGFLWFWRTSSFTTCRSVGLRQLHKLGTTCVVRVQTPVVFQFFITLPKIDLGLDDFTAIARIVLPLIWQPIITPRSKSLSSYRFAILLQFKMLCVSYSIYNTSCITTSCIVFNLSSRMQALDLNKIRLADCFCAYLLDYCPVL